MRACRERGRKEGRAWEEGGHATAMSREDERDDGEERKREDKHDGCNSMLGRMNKCSEVDWSEVRIIQWVDVDGEYLCYVRSMMNWTRENTKTKIPKAVLINTKMLCDHHPV